ncbi:MAG: response regulator [Ignavibacteriales bacterium]|nr:MAG: response regulator [Ignavibacteriales bacterium]
MNSDEKKSVLIIDDDITIRKLISHHLKIKDYSVLEATNPDEGFSQLNNQKVDLVLCDVTMGDMDGFSFCRKVRESEKYRLLPFVFVTAKNSIEDKSMALEAGGDDIITKPFDVNDLLIKVQALIRRSDIYKVYGAKKHLEQSFSSAMAKILIVDDDVSLAKLFQFNLNKAGFDCSIAISAEEGFKMAHMISPDLIISDIMMPGVDGYEFRKMLLADQQLKSIPFVFLTAKGNETDILDGYDLGIADYVVKTAGPRVVVAKVSAIIKSLGKEREKVVTELHDAADSLRAKVVPESFPELDGFDIKHWHIPFQGIPGGDFLDYFPLDDNHMAVVLGDVMGKKWGAWYFAFAYAGYVRSALRVVLQNAKGFTPSDILQRVNNSVYQDAKVSEVFATLSILVIDKQNKTVKYTGAGDLPIIYKNGTTGEMKRIQSNGLLLGFAAEGNYSDVFIQLNKNDLLFMLTDGIFESRNAAGEPFGSKKLMEVVAEVNDSVDALEKIKSEFSLFTNSKFEDDLSLIVIKSR